jgi:hypothetical protein
VVCGVWCVVCGVWCVVCGVVCGVWCVVCGVWCVQCAVRLHGTVYMLTAVTVDCELSSWSRNSESRFNYCFAGHASNSFPHFFFLEP